jgi:iron complex outermembrane receptor protein
MKTCISSLRLAALPLALASAFAAPSVFAQTQPVTTLNEVLVTANRAPGARESQPFGTSVISAEDIQRAGAVTVNDAIMRILGIPGRQDYYGGGDYALDLRGFGTTADSNQVVIVDGIRINEADLGGTRLAGIPIESVVQIEVIRGSGAVLYGEGATGGVIIITTKAGKGIARNNSASLYAAVGSYGLREQRANATLASGGFSLDVNAMNRSADNHRDNFRSDTDAVSAVAQWSNDWLRAGARVAQDGLNTGMPGSLTASEYQSNPRQTTTPNDKASIDNNRNSLFAEASLGDWLLAADAGWREKKLRSSGVGFYGPYTYDYDVKATNYALRAVHSAKLSAFTNSLTFGTDYSSWQRDSLGAYPSTANQSSHAWYARNELTRAATGTALTLGLRTERINKTNTNSVVDLAGRENAWELGLSQPISPVASVYARAGRSFRLANVDEFGFTSPGLSLLPQHSQDMELGARWRYGKGKAEIRVYRSDLNNEIGYDPLAVGPYSPGSPGANVNFDPTRRQGLEAEFSHAITQTVDVRANAALRKASFRSGAYTGKDVPLAPRRTLAIQAGWQMDPAHRLSGGINWVSEQHPDFSNACTMPAYTTLDVRYAYKFKNAELSLGVSNLTDRKYYSQAFGCTGGTTSAIYPEAGRAFTVALRMNF